MSYCPKCGREIVDESLGCPICSVRENSRVSLTKSREEVHTEEEAAIVEKVESFSVESDNATNQSVENQTEIGGTWGQSANPQFQQRNAAEGNVIPTPLKVLIIVLLIVVSLFFSGFGAIAGLIAGIILMRSPVLDYQKFGKTLTIISGVLLGISLICCLILGGLFSLGVIADTRMY